MEMKSKKSYLRAGILLLITILIFAHTLNTNAFKLTSLDKYSYPPPIIPEEPVNPNYLNYVYIPVIAGKQGDLSYYLTTTNDIYGLGFTRGAEYASESGAQNGLVILDFGSPFYYSGNYGVMLFDLSTILYAPQIQSAVQVFSQGVWGGLGADYESVLSIIVGTNSSGYHVSYGHGQAWGIMINELNSWLNAQGYSGQIRIYGGNDIETNFRPPAEAIAWVDGYSSTGYYPVYNYGNASACPLDYPPTEPRYQSGIVARFCEGGWTQDHVYQVSWGSLRAFPFPEIYNTLGANAQQWYRIGLYGNLKYGVTMDFQGSMTQYSACEQKRNPYSGELSQDCIGTNNPPITGHDQLAWWLGHDPYNRMMEPLYWMTDIVWYYGVP